MVSFICAHCGAIADVDDDDVLLDTGITFLCPCGKYTVVELRPTAASPTAPASPAGDEPGDSRAGSEHVGWRPR